MSKLIKTEEYNYVMPTWALIVICNADVSACNNDDIARLDDFIETLPVNDKGQTGTWDFPDVDENQYFTSHNDIDGSIGGDVVDAVYTLFFYSEETNNEQ